MNRNVLIILVAAVAIAGIFGLFVYDSLRERPLDMEYVSGPVKNPNEYQERIDAAWEKNKATLEPELAPICGADYSVSCILNAALSRLLSVDVTNDPAFTVLINLTDTIIKSGDKILMGRHLKILQGQELKLLTQDRKIRIAIMKLQFALGDFSSGFKTLESFKTETEDFEFVGVPPVIAINFLIESNRLDDANRVALMTKEWGIKIGEPPPQCFGRDSNADSIAGLIVANFAAERYENFLPLLTVITEEDSPYYDSDGYNRLRGELTMYYHDHPEAKPVPKDICVKFLEDGAYHLSQLLNLLGTTGCKEEHIIVAERAKKMSGTPDVRIVLGEGQQVLNEAAFIESDFERFKAYLDLARQFQRNKLPELRNEAIAKAIAMHEQTSHGFDKNDANWTGYLVNALRYTGQEEELKELQDKLVQEARATNDPRLIQSLADHLDINHPDYAWIAKLSDKFTREENAKTPHMQSDPNRMRNLYFEKAKILIQENKPDEAREVLALIDPQYYDYSLYQIFPALLATNPRGELFEEIWSKRIKDCLKSALVQLETNDPAVVIPHCMNQILGQGLAKNTGIP